MGVRAKELVEVEAGASRALAAGTGEGTEEVVVEENEAGDARMATGDETAKSDPAACVPIYGRCQMNKLTRPFTVCFERVGECRWLNARRAATRDARRLDGPELSPQHERPSKCRAGDTSPGIPGTTRKCHAVGKALGGSRNG